MRRVELGVEYVTLEGISIFANSIHEFSGEDRQVMCSDGWWRHLEGPTVGMFVSESLHPEFRHHIDWVEFDASQRREPEQLELF